MTPREERIVELAQEKLAKLIEEYVEELYEEYEADGEIDEEIVQEIVQDIFTGHKEEVKTAAEEEWHAGASQRSKIFDAIYKGFTHYIFCENTAREKAHDCI